MIPDDLISATSPLVVFAECLTSGWLLPVPEDVILLYAGLKLGDGTLGWGPTLLVTYTGVLLRDLFAWSLGRFVGEKVLTLPATRWMVSAERVDQARDWVSSNGFRAVLVGRFMVGFRFPMFVAAGLGRVPFRTFVGVDAIALLLVVPGMLAAGAFAGPGFVAAARRFVTGSSLFFYLLIAVIVGSWFWARGRRSERE